MYYFKIHLFIKKQNDIDLPFSVTPKVAKLKGHRDASLTDAKYKAIDALKEKFRQGKYSESEYRSKAAEIESYYENAKNLPADVSSWDIVRQAPSFGNTNSIGDDISSDDSHSLIDSIFDFLDSIF